MGKGWYMTVNLPHSGPVERHIIIPIPDDMEEGTKTPAYLRYYVNPERCDPPQGRPEAFAAGELASFSSNKDEEGDVPTSPEIPSAKTIPPAKSP